jgi:mannose-6-phosphate isomerase-like protein (cupin superfamily)
VPFISLSDAPRFELPNVTFTGLASPQRGSRENSVWRVTIAPNTPGLPHQLTREETIFVLSGTAIAEIGKEQYRVSEGDVIIVPAMTDFSLSNEGAEAFEAIAVLPVGGQAIVGNDAPFTPPWAA